MGLETILNKNTTKCHVKHAEAILEAFKKVFKK